MEVSVNETKVKIEPASVYIVQGEGIDSLEKIPKEKLNDNTIYLIHDKEIVGEKEIEYCYAYVYSKNKFILVEKAVINDEDPLNQKE